MTSYQTHNLIPYDLEVYPNYFLFGALWKGKPLALTNPEQILRFLKHITTEGHQLVGFNSHGYDDIVLTWFLRERTPKAAYEMSVRIIEGGLKPWQVDFPIAVKSIDLMPVLPGRKSLKQLGVTLGHKRLQELPIDPHKPLTEAEKEIIRDYNANDLEITRKLLDKLQPELDLRGKMSAMYGVDLRSKGEVQIAETILLSEAGLRKYDVKTLAQEAVQRQPWFTIRPPSWWGALKEMEATYPSLAIVREIGREITGKKVRLHDGQFPAGLFSRAVYLGDKYYRMGIGGLHSIDGAGAIVPGEGEALIDWDVASYYPSIILTQKLEPAHWGGKFLPVYQSIVDRRLAAKRSGDKVTADVLKIVANGSFGKFGDQYSPLYCPELLAHVTLYGQLGLLALIAMLTDNDCRVVSANTDGVTVLHHNEMLTPDAGISDFITHEWMNLTALELEATEYRALYQKTVNDYVAIKTDGTLKCKGDLVSEVDLRHMPAAPVIARAVSNNASGTNYEIRNCTDINQFLFAAKVAGGWRVLHGDKPLGRIVRWYKSTRRDLPQIIREPIRDDIKGNRGIVPNSENGVPLMDLPEGIPEDLDYDWYVEQADDLLAQITKPKMHGMNEYAEELVARGLEPCIVKRNGDRLSRAKAVYGTYDFNAIPEGHYMAVRTGDGIMAVLENDVLLRLGRVQGEFPSSTRPTIEKKEGFRLIYGGSVELPVGDIEVVGITGLESFYTEAELRRVRG